MPGSRNDGDVNKILSEGYGRTSKYYQFVSAWHVWRGGKMSFTFW